MGIPANINDNYYALKRAATSLKRRLFVNFFVITVHFRKKKLFMSKKYQSFSLFHSK